MLRVYILNGIGLMSHDTNEKSDPFIEIKHGDTIIYDLKNSLRKTTNNPEFYTKYEMNATFPGDGILIISVKDSDGFGSDDLIGETVLDLEDRYYSEEWKALPVKPIEERILMLPSTVAPQGTLRLWVDVVPVMEAKKSPMWDISPPPPAEFEIRIIIWGAKDIVFKDVEVYIYIIYYIYIYI